MIIHPRLIGMILPSTNKHIETLSPKDSDGNGIVDFGEFAQHGPQTRKVSSIGSQAEIWKDKNFDSLKSLSAFVVVLCI